MTGTRYSRRGFFQAIAAAGIAKAAPKLTIKEIRAVELRGYNSRFVRVYTDQGLTGTGEMVDNIGSAAIINEKLGPAIAGRDPLDIESIYLHFWSFGRVPDSTPPVFMRGTGGGPYLSAVSGIEMALWDLAGKAMDVPVYRLLGGKVRNRIPVYAWYGETDYVKNTLQKKCRAFKLGIDSITAASDFSITLDPGAVHLFHVTNAQLDAIVERVRAARELIGPKTELALECHTRYDTESAIQIGRAVAPYRPMWLEEPVPSDNFEAMALVRRSVPVPIACGENVYTRYGFRDVIERQAAAIIQPDMTKCGGLLETKKIAAHAETYHIPIAPHGVGSPLAGMAYAHVCATTPNFLILEWGHLFRPKGPGVLVKNQPDYADGFVRLSEAPGIGIELNDEVVRANLQPGFTWS